MGGPSSALNMPLSLCMSLILCLPKSNERKFPSHIWPNALDTLINCYHSCMHKYPNSQVVNVIKVFQIDNKRQRAINPKWTKRKGKTLEFYFYHTYLLCSRNDDLLIDLIWIWLCALKNCPLFCFCLTKAFKCIPTSYGLSLSSIMIRKHFNDIIVFEWRRYAKAYLIGLGFGWNTLPCEQKSAISNDDKISYHFICAHSAIFTFKSTL